MIVNPSTIAAFVSLAHCDKYLLLSRKDLANSACVPTFHEPETAAEARGGETEGQFEEILLKYGYVPRIEKNLDAVFGDLRSGNFYWAHVAFSEILPLDSGQVDVRGEIDFLLCEKAGNLPPLFTIVECKSTERVRNAAQIQASLYHHAVSRRG